MSNDTSLAGTILDIDLTRRTVRRLRTADHTDGVLGGLGIAVKALLDRIPQGVHPLDPENLITFSAGVLVGTAAPSACRTTIASMNVLTGGYGSASAAGFFAPELKYAGYDNIFVTGRAERPVYLYICDDRVELRDAEFLWGRTTWETEDLIWERNGDPSLQVLSIGPAGENQVAAANIMVSRYRSASRCGLGAIMGSKNLKAIAVRGSGTIHVAQPDSFVRCSGKYAAQVNSTLTATMLRRFGTPASFPKWNKIGNLPGRNYQATTLTEAASGNLTPETLKDQALRKNVGCFACSIQCTQSFNVKSGQFGGTAAEKLECQAFWDFGAKVGLESVEAVIKGSTLCGELGLDMSNATGCISWAMECYQKGLITREDAGGLDLSWGNTDAVLDLLKQIAHQRGLGPLLKNGALAAARKLGKGSEAFAMNIKGQDLAEEFRGLVGWALGIMVSERGGAHTTGAPLAERYSISPEKSKEMFGVTSAADPMAYDGKAEIVVYYQRFHAALEALGSCFFSSNWIGSDLLGPADYVTLYNLAMGTDISVDDMMRAGERIHTMQKLFNVKHAKFTRQDDVPQDRMFEVPASSASFRIGLERDKWNKMLDTYYTLHRWDVNTGIPRPEALSSLGLENYAGIL